MAQRTFSVGEHVHVPWGLDVVEGVVVSTYGEGEARQVVVSVILPDAGTDSGDAEDTTVTLPAKVLEEAEAEADQRRPGSWLPALRYEQDLSAALANIVSSQWGERARFEHTGSSPDVAEESRPDIEVRFPDRTVLVEAKNATSGTVSENAVAALLVMLAMAHAAVGLLVTNGELSPRAEERLRDANREGVSLRAVRWRNDRDNQRLVKALNELLAA